MQRDALAVLMVVLAGCARGVSGQAFPLPGGGLGYDLRCPGNTEACLSKAAELCTRGHDVLRSEASGELMVRCRDDNPWPPPAVSSHPAPVAGPPAQRTPEQIVRAARQSVYLVSTPVGRATGFGIRSGRIVTSLQAVLGHSIVWITDAQGQRRQVVGVRTFDSEHDLAILDAGVALSPGLELAQPEMPAAGAKVVIFGNPQAVPGSVSNGVVSGVQSANPELTLLQIDAPIPPGSSGGPVLNSEGKVVAVLVSPLTTGQNLNAAVPVRHLRESVAKSKGSITMSTFAAITAAPAAPPRLSSAESGRKKKHAFPISVAGFAFGMSIADAQQACKGKLAGDPNFSTCSFKPVDVPFANNNVSIRFEAGRLTRVYLRGNSWDDVTSVTLAKYGQPGLVEVRNGGSWKQGSGWKKGTASRATWWLDGGMLVVFSQDGRDLALIYVSAAPEELREKTIGDGR